MTEPITLDSPETLRARIAGSKLAAEALEMLAGEEPAYHQGFYRTIVKALPPEHRPKPVTTLRPMSDQESRAFGNTLVPFGQHQGARYDQIDLNYLDWIVQKNEELRRYVASRRVRTEDEDEHD